ncbi:MAG: glycosyltransferase [Nitrospiraceae bacterium]
MNGMADQIKIGIFDHLSLRLGGSQSVVANMAGQLSQRYAVDVIHSGRGYTLGNMASAFDVDLSRVGERIISESLDSFSLPGPTSALRYLPKRLAHDRQLTDPYDFFIYSGHGAPPFCSARRGLIYCHFPFESHPKHDLQRSEGWERRHDLDRWVRSKFYGILWARRLRGYQALLCNSQFTAGWIERLWHRHAQVVYPPVRLDAPVIEKQNMIASVGRFIVTDGKNHALQLKVFRQFLQANGGDWRLSLIGFCTDLPQDRSYLDQLRELAEGLPVTFVVNASRQAVFTQLAQAKLFWHATALGGGTSDEPEGMEHFGIATVEAMGAGCVPMVPMSGGQPEIVEHEVNGFLCRDAAALLQYSGRLANDESLREAMSRSAKERSTLFRPEVFTQQLHQVVSRVLGDRNQRGRTCHNSLESSLSSIR